MSYGAIPKTFKPRTTSYGNMFQGGNTPQYGNRIGTKSYGDRFTQDARKLQPGGSFAPASYGNMPNMSNLPGVTHSKPPGSGTAPWQSVNKPMSPYRPQVQQAPSPEPTATSQSYMSPMQPQAPLYPQAQQQHAVNQIRAQAAQQADPYWQNKMDIRAGVSRDLDAPLTPMALGRVAAINVGGMEDSAEQALKMRIANQQYQLQGNRLTAGNRLSSIGEQLRREQMMAQDDLSRKQLALQSLGF